MGSTHNVEWTLVDRDGKAGFVARRYLK
jgi:hypothetical protein